VSYPELKRRHRHRQAQSLYRLANSRRPPNELEFPAVNMISKRKYAPPHALERALEAIEVYRDVTPLLGAWVEEGATQEEIARRLNELGHRTREGRPWTQVQVGRVMKYVGASTAST
jgi:hypothetical protein